MGGSVDTGSQKTTDNQTQQQQAQQQQQQAYQQQQNSILQTAQQYMNGSNPYGAATAGLNSTLANTAAINPNLNDTQTGALNSLSALGAAGNPFQGGINNVANTLLAGGNANGQAGTINDAYARYQQQMNPYASGQFNDPSSNPTLQAYLKVARDDAANNINGQFAGAGRDLSGMNSQALGRGITQAEAPILMDAYNQSLGRQMQASGNLYNAGNTTAGLLSGLNQQGLANQQAGIGASQQATQAQQYGPLLQLQAESQRTGIPLQNLAAQMGITLPAAQAFGTQFGASSGTQTGSNTSSGFGSSSGTSSSTGTSQDQKTTQNQSPLWQQMAGGLIGGAGILGGTGAFGKNGWLGFGGTG